MRPSVPSWRPTLLQEEQWRYHEIHKESVNDGYIAAVAQGSYLKTSRKTPEQDFELLQKKFMAQEDQINQLDMYAPSAHLILEFMVQNENGSRIEIRIQNTQSKSSYLVIYFYRYSSSQANLRSELLCAL